MLISQNLTAEFMPKVYADLETCLPMVEADRVLFRHLVMFLTVFFHWMYKMKYSRYQGFFRSSWLVCLLRFWLRNAPLVKVIGNPNQMT